MSSTTIKLIILALLALYGFRGFSIKNEPPLLLDKGDTLTLHPGEEKTVLNEEVMIKYSHYSHEHSSSSPDQPFEASIGVYNFELTTNKVTETITIYLGVNQQNSAVDWKRYKITLFSSTPDQKEIIVGVSRLE